MRFPILPLGVTAIALTLAAPVALARSLPPMTERPSARMLRERSVQEQQRSNHYAHTADQEQLYTNAPLDLSLRFPRGWTAQDIWHREGTVTTVALFLSPKTGEDDHERENVSLVTERLAAPLSLDAYTLAAISREQGLFDAFVLQRSQDLLLPQGMPAHSIVFTAEPMGLPLTFEQVWMQRQGQMMVWTLAASAETFDQYATLFHSMLQSVTFN